MKVKFRLDIFIDEDDISDCSTEIWWNDCNWAEVTSIQDCMITALRKMNEYVECTQQFKTEDSPA